MLTRMFESEHIINYYVLTLKHSCEYKIEYTNDDNFSSFAHSILCSPLNNNDTVTMMMAIINDEEDDDNDEDGDINGHNNYDPIKNKRTNIKFTPVRTSDVTTCKT